MARRAVPFCRWGLEGFAASLYRCGFGHLGGKAGHSGGGVPPLGERLCAPHHLGAPGTLRRMCAYMPAPLRPPEAEIVDHSASGRRRVSLPQLADLIHDGIVTAMAFDGSQSASAMACRSPAASVLAAAGSRFVQAWRRRWVRSRCCRSQATANNSTVLPAWRSLSQSCRWAWPQQWSELRVDMPGSM